jgi:hypothetical protein
MEQVRVIRYVAQSWMRLKMAGRTSLELATSGVTGRRSNQLNYRPRMAGWTEGELSYPLPRGVSRQADRAYKGVLSPRKWM